MTMFRFLQLVMLLLIPAAESLAKHPAEDVAAAAHDAITLPEIERHQTRYLAFPDLEEAEQRDLVAAVSYVLNAASHQNLIRRPRKVGDRLWAFRINDYAKTKSQRIAWCKAWESLARDDPFYHLKTEVLVGGTRKIVTIDGSWIDEGQTKALRLLTNSCGAVLRADYFVVQASSTLRGGIYYELAGIPESQADYFSVFGIDVRKTIGVEARRGANLFISGVTQKPRRLLRLQGPLGGSYVTFDSADNTADRDPFRLPVDANGGFHVDYDAGEFISVAPNGLMKFALYDSTFKRQQSVPDNIAKDDSDPTGDGVLQPMISCVRCHREDGIFSFEDDFQSMLKSGVDFVSTNEDVIAKATAFYDQDQLQEAIRFDRERYAKACKTATGLTGAEVSDALTRAYRRFAFTAVTADIASRELGTNEKEFTQSLNSSTDPILLALRLGRAVAREQWHASFAEAALLANRQEKP